MSGAATANIIMTGLTSVGSRLQQLRHIFSMLSPGWTVPIITMGVLRLNFTPDALLDTNPVSQRKLDDPVLGPSLWHKHELADYIASSLHCTFRGRPTIRHLEEIK